MYVIIQVLRFLYVVDSKGVVDSDNGHYVTLVSTWLPAGSKRTHIHNDTKVK